MADIWNAKYNILSSKPADDDHWWIGDKDAAEQKVMEHSVLKSFFVKTDEDTNITANHEFQDNKQLRFGSSRQFEMYDDGTDMYMKGTTSAGKLKIQLDSTDFLVLDPINNSVKCGDRAFNYDGAASRGCEFSSNNRLHCLDILEIDAGISMNLKNISYTGVVDTGLEFDISNNATFKQDLNIEGIFTLQGNFAINGGYISQTGASSGFHMSGDDGIFDDKLTVGGLLDVNANVAAAGNYISYTGGNGTGLHFTATNSAIFEQNVAVNGDISATDMAVTSIFADGHIQAISYIQGYRLRLSDSTATPATVANVATIYIAAANTVRVKFADGTDKRFSVV